MLSKTELLTMKYRNVLNGNLDENTEKIENFRKYVLPSLAMNVVDDNGLKRYPCQFMECRNVARDYSTRTTLLNHLVEKHGHVLPNDGQFLLGNWNSDADPKTFLCMDCGLEFRREDKYRRHLRTMTHIRNRGNNARFGVDGSNRERSPLQVRQRTAEDTKGSNQDDVVVNQTPTNSGFGTEKAFDAT